MSVFSAEQFRALAEQALVSGPMQQGMEHTIAQEPIKDPAWHDGEVTQLKDAAVLIPIVQRGHGASVILTQRTHHLPSHAGEIAFPGGKVDAHDATAIAAALREAEEEIGLAPSLVQVFAEMRPYISSTGYRIFPILAHVDASASMEANPCEVAEIFEVPLAFLMDPGNHQRKSAQWRGKTRSYFAMPYGDYYIWGVTAGILRNLYETVFEP